MQNQTATTRALCVFVIVFLSSFVAFQAWAQDTTRLYLPLIHRQSPAIAFSKDGIAVADADGKGILQLTPSSLGGFGPSWSPDGTKIVFFARKAASVPRETSSLYVIHADGTGLRQLTNESYTAYNPVWSPDGSTIAFALDRSGVRNIYLIESDGSNLRQLTNEPFGADEPTWSPGGLRIAFTQFTTEFDRRIAVISVNEREVKAIAIPPFWFCRDPDWAPSGERLAYVCRTDTLARILRISNSDGTNVQTVLIETDLIGPRGFTNPEWSPDGSQLAFGLVYGLAEDLYAVNIAGTETRLLVQGATGGAWKP